MKNLTEIFGSVFLAMILMAQQSPGQKNEDLAPQGTQLSSEGRAIDVTVGHAAPYVMDFDGDGKKDLLVGEFGTGTFDVKRLPAAIRKKGSRFSEGKLRIYRNVGTNDAPKFSGFKYLKAGNEHASIPTT